MEQKNKGSTRYGEPMKKYISKDKIKRIKSLESFIKINGYVLFLEGP